MRDWWRSGDAVTLVCRPRRFGKTLNLDTVRCFLSREFAGRGDELFGGLEVWGEDDMRGLQGAVPGVRRRVGVGTRREERRGCRGWRRRTRTDGGGGRACAGTCRRGLAAVDAATLAAGLAAGDAAATGEDEVAEGSEGETVPDGEPALSAQSVGTLLNPVIIPNSNMNSGQVVTWDCVWLGSYPQTEVPETSALWMASWKDGEATVGGIRYRRILKEDTFNQDYWGNASGYRYFRYEPIKWRILKVNGNTALAMADVVLDCRTYHKTMSSVTWETSTIRSWLNGTGTVPYYTAGAQSGRIAQSFMSVAFDPDQRGALMWSTITNASGTFSGISGGNTTTDRVFLLSEAEVLGASATAHGFSSENFQLDEGRFCKTTDYANAMGVGDGWKDCCYWWLRSPGGETYRAADVRDDAAVDNYGGVVDRGPIGVRPAVNLNLSSPYITWAGTVSSDGTVVKSVWPFPDVPADSWCSHVVYRATKHQFMSGYPDGNFGPDNLITRGQAAVALWNLAGMPAIGADPKCFPDVMSSEYYWRAVSWASGVGVASGYPNGNFGPNDNITREQFAVMLANYYEKVVGKTVSGSAADYQKMKDAASVSDWARPSVGWCFANGILSGAGEYILPQGSTTRAQAAKMVMYLFDMFGQEFYVIAEGLE